MTAAHAESPLYSPFRAKCARLTDPRLISCAQVESVNALANMLVASSALRRELQSEAEKPRSVCVLKSGRSGAVVFLMEHLPDMFKEDISLGQWVDAQRTLHNTKKKMLPCREELLNEIGFPAVHCSPTTDNDVSGLVLVGLFYALARSFFSLYCSCYA